MGGHHHSHYIGLQLYDGAPHVEGTHFADFVDDDYKLAGAIGYRKPHAGVKTSKTIIHIIMKTYLFR